MKAVILAGGRGERLGSLIKDIPKPMIEIGGKPVLEHQIDLLRSYGITDIYILTGYLGHVIKNYFGGGKSFGVTLSVQQEEKPLGTSGCIRVLKDKLTENFLILYGDVMLDFDIDAFINFHNSKGGRATLVVHPNDHPYDSDLLVLDEDKRIVDILLKDRKPEYYSNLASAAVYILSPRVFEYLPEGTSDFVKDIFPKMLHNSERLYGYKSAEYIKDMGTMDRLEKVNEDFLTGRIKRLSKKNSRPAIFFDRDGTLVKEAALLHTVEELEIFPFAAGALRKISESDFLSFLITNQPVVARNLCDISTVKLIHYKLETLLGDEGAYLNDIYFCPHHPDKGYPEENPLYKIVCDCRKPKTGMVEKAAGDYNVDLKSSWLIGDTTTDIQTGMNAGLKTVLVRTGRGGKDKKYDVLPDYVFDNMADAVDYILDGTKKYETVGESILDKVSANHKENPFIITVGGPARSGKSIFSAWLKDHLQRDGISCTIIDLDNWLLGVEQRQVHMTVRDRFKYPDIEDDLNRLLKGEKILINHYDPYSRVITDKQALSLKDEKCVIVVGVPALDIAALRKRSSLRIYMEVDEARRKDRFFSFYQWKDLEAGTIAELYETRMKDEYPIIEGSKRYADYVII